MKRFVPVGLLALLLVGCNSASSVRTSSASPSTAPPSLSPTPSPKPEKAAPVTLRGAYKGTCDLVKTSDPSFPESLKHQNIRWKFRPDGHKIALFSKTGGYTMPLTRTAKTKFYGSVTTGGWQYAYTVTASDVQDNGLATTVHVVDHDTATGGTLNDTLVCDLTLA